MRMIAGSTPGQRSKSGEHSPVRQYGFLSRLPRYTRRQLQDFRWRSGFPNSGADWLDRFKPYINDGKTVVVSPHKVWGPQTNDLVLQLGKRRFDKSRTVSVRGDALY